MFECNNSLCNKKFYLQINGTAESHHMSFYYSVIAFAVYDERTMDNPFKPRIWKGFRDDLITLWIHSVENVKTLSEYFNTNILNLLYVMRGVI